MLPKGLSSISACLLLPTQQSQTTKHNAYRWQGVWMERPLPTSTDRTLGLEFIPARYDDDDHSATATGDYETARRRCAETTAAGLLLFFQLVLFPGRAVERLHTERSPEDRGVGWW